MSLTDLPTELDARILQFLNGQQGLMPMSCVSKYYHQIANPILYRDIRMSSAPGSMLKQLLTILLDRPELAKIIKTVAITGIHTDDKHAADYAARVACLRKFSTYVNRVKDQIAACLRPFTGNSIEFPFNCGIFRQDPSSPDEALALILMMAVNVESIQLATTDPHERLHYTRWVLKQPTQDSYAEIDALAFQKLKHLDMEWSTSGYTINNTISFPTRPGLRTLRVAGRNVTYGKGASDLIGKMEVLESLDLGHNDMRPTAIVKMLKCGAFKNLKRLDIDTPGKKGWSCGSSNIYNQPSKFVQALATHVPELETFEFYGEKEHSMHSWNRVDSFGAFTSLVKLHTLRLDIDRLLYANGTNESSALDPCQLLPPSLRRLHICAMPSPRVNKYYEGREIVSAYRLVLDIARVCPLEELCLEVVEEHGPRDETA